MTDETSDLTLSAAEQDALRALLGTILPASADGRMPSAAELDFPAYVSAQAGGFWPGLRALLSDLPTDFADKSQGDRAAILKGIATGQPKAFDDLIFRVYDCYYQNDAVRLLIGSHPVPPFPRGNEIPAGDLSSLDAVVQRSPGYRR